MKGIFGLLLGFTLATAIDAADQPHEGKGTTSMKALFTSFTCALVLVVTATVATSHTYAASFASFLLSVFAGSKCGCLRRPNSQK